MGATTWMNVWWRDRKGGVCSREMEEKEKLRWQWGTGRYEEFMGRPWPGLLLVAMSGSGVYVDVCWDMWTYGVCGARGTEAGRQQWTDWGTGRDMLIWMAFTAIRGHEDIWAQVADSGHVWTMEARVCVDVPGLLPPKAMQISLGRLPPESLCWTDPTPPQLLHSGKQGLPAPHLGSTVELSLVCGRRWTSSMTREWEGANPVPCWLQRWAS